jgi:DNA-directed RNA polymerase alpha subunit
MAAGPGDWIVRGTAGEFYPVKNHIFTEIYESVDACLDRPPMLRARVEAAAGRFLTDDQWRRFLDEPAPTSDRPEAAWPLSIGEGPPYMSVRLYNICFSEGLSTFGDLAAMTANELLEVRNVGETTLDNARRVLAKYGLALKGESPNDWR